MNKDSFKTHSIGPHLLVAPPTISLVTARSNLHPPATWSLRGDAGPPPKGGLNPDAAALAGPPGGNPTLPGAAFGFLVIVAHDGNAL